MDAATDIGTLSDIWLAASLKAHPFIGESRLTEQRRLIETVYLPKAETWVACEDGTPIGFISLLEHFIGGIFVDPAKQGRGVGRQLTAHALALKGELTLEVYTRNTQAMAFYASQGFTEQSRRALDDEGYPFENAALHLKR